MYDENRLLSPERESSQVIVDSYEVKGETWYSIIKARRPSTWKYGLNTQLAVSAVDVYVQRGIFLTCLSLRAKF